MMMKKRSLVLMFGLLVVLSLGFVYAFGACEADVNGDGIVNLFDLVKVRTSLGEDNNSIGWCRECDIDENNVVNINDLKIVRVNLGDSCRLFCDELYDRINKSFEMGCGDDSYDELADIDKSGFVDFGDLSFYAGNKNNQSWCEETLKNTTNPCVVCYNDYDCPNKITKYCNETNNQSCMKVVNYRCDKHGTAKSKCVLSGVGEKCVDCEFGCENGVCLPEKEYYCNETDDGFNIFEKGFLEIYSPGYAPFYDSEKCEGNGVWEVWCEWNEGGDGGGHWNIGGAHIKCEKGCVDGACVREQVCEDSDGGLNYFVKGYITYPSWNGRVLWDYCVSSSRIGEYFCPANPGETRISYVDCPLGQVCENGACSEIAVKPEENSRRLVKSFFNRMLRREE